MGTRRTYLHLEIDPDSEPVTGQVGRMGAEPRPFTGYASLIAALQAIRKGDPEPDRAGVAGQRDGLERP